MVTKVVAVMYKNNNTVLEVSNKIIARGKTAQKLISPLLINFLSNANIAILNNMIFDRDDIIFRTTPFIFENPAHIKINNKHDRTFTLTLTLNDGNKRNVMEKDHVITTMTQKNMLKQIKDDENSFFKVVTMSFNGKDIIGFIKKVEVLKNNNYKLHLIGDKKNFNQLSDETTINKITYTSIEKVKVETQNLDAVRFLNSICSNFSKRQCRCRWCNNRGCRYIALQ